MIATIVDLRYRMKDVLRALDRNEEVTVTRRGKAVAALIPKGEPKKKAKKKKERPMAEHPFVGSMKDDPRSVEEIMQELRGGRFRDI